MFFEDSKQSFCDYLSQTFHKYISLNFQQLVCSLSFWRFISLSFLLVYTLEENVVFVKQLAFVFSFLQASFFPPLLIKAPTTTTNTLMHA